MKEKKLKIKLTHWDHTCGDGCCYTSGTDMIINGEELEGDFYGIEGEQLKTVLEHLGYEVELEEVYE